MNKVYTPKQLELLRLWQYDRLKRINLLSGSVRSGKTWISLVLWAFWVGTMPRDKSYLMTAKSLTTLKRNTLDLLTELVGEKNFTYSLAQKEAWLFGRKVYLEGANDARSESKIRGMTLQGAYCDELTLFGEDFFAMLLSRLSEPKAKLIATTNPDSPKHWLYENYIERRHELNMLVMEFLIEDNTFLDSVYVEELKKEYVGVFYDRFILGQWVVAEGLVYRVFEEKKSTIVKKCDIAGYNEFYVSIDYGTVNPCSMGLWGVNNKEAARLKESYFDSRGEGRQRTDEEHYQELLNLVGDIPIERVIVDPSAASFIECIRRHGKFRVKAAVNDVIDGIRVVSSLLNADMLHIDSSCKACIHEFGLYRWDEKKDRDTVLKENDHAMDEVRYFCNTVLRKRFKWLDWR